MGRLAGWRTHPRKESALLLATAVALAITVTFAAASARARSTVHPTAALPAVKIANTPVGPLLVNRSGRTVYMSVRGKRTQDECMRTKGCERDWPPVTTVGKPAAGPGVKKSLLGTIPYKGKLREVTYKGHPLHTYRFDTAKGAVINIGIVQYGSAWYPVNADAVLIK